MVKEAILFAVGLLMNSFENTVGDTDEVPAVELGQGNFSFQMV